MNFRQASTGLVSSVLDGQVFIFTRTPSPGPVPIRAAAGVAVVATVFATLVAVTQPEASASTDSVAGGSLTGLLNNVSVGSGFGSSTGSEAALSAGSSLGSLTDLGIGSSSASGSPTDPAEPGDIASTGTEDDYFQFNVSGDTSTSPSGSSAGRSTAANPSTDAVPYALAGAHGDWGGRRADTGPFWMTSAATGKYVSRQFGAFWHDLPKDNASTFTLLPDGWGTVRIKESSTGQCLRVYESSNFRQRSPLVDCEGATGDRAEEEIRWLVLPAQSSNASTKASGKPGGFILANYRNAKCLTIPGREVSTIPGHDLHLDGTCNTRMVNDLQVFHPEGVDATATEAVRAAFTETALTYAIRNCADGGSKTQFDCVFSPAGADSWATATEVPEAVCVTPGETNNTATTISKEVTTREDSGWTLKVGREFTANTSLEPKFLSALGLKVSAGLKLTQDQTWTGATSEGTKLTLQTEPGHTSWVSRELRVREVDGTWAFGVSRLPWVSAPGPVRVPVKDAYQLSYNSAYFNSNHPFTGCATRNKVEPTVRPSLTQAGDTLTVSPGAWPTDAWSLGYRWFKQRGAAREIISTSDAPTFTRTSSDDKSTPIGVIVTAYREGYAPTSTVIDAEPPA